MFIIPKVLIISIITGIAIQILKTFITSWKNKKFFDIHSLSHYGGMPSAHAAFLSSLSVAVLLEDGLSSTTFAICVIFSLIIIRDAFGFRMLLENQGKIMKRMVDENPEKYKDLENNKRFKTLGMRVGHTLPEIAVGIILGSLISIALFFLI